MHRIDAPSRYGRAASRKADPPANPAAIANGSTGRQHEDAASTLPAAASAAAAVCIPDDCRSSDSTAPEYNGLPLENGSMSHVRIDKWLWAARFFKTRSLASRACDLGRIESKGVTAKPAREVHTGDMLRI